VAVDHAVARVVAVAVVGAAAAVGADAGAAECSRISERRRRGSSQKTQKMQNKL
jgi:hypothetical protein